MGKKFDVKKWWSKRRERGFTFMAVPNAGGHPARLHLPMNLLLAIFLFGFVLLGFNIYMWIAYPAQIHHISNLYDEIDKRDRTIERLDRENKQIEPSIERGRQQAKQLEQIQVLEAEAKALMDAVRKKGGRITTGSSRGVILRNRLSENLRVEVPGTDGKDSRLATLDRNLDILERELDARERQLKGAIAGLKETVYRLDHTPSLWPVPLVRITSRFGTRRDPFTGGRDVHHGLDLHAYTGQPVRATAAGRVVFAGYQGSYGYKVEIDHGFGIRSIYAHNSRIAVHVGQIVSKGQVICYAGSTGRSTAPHVHFEIRLSRQPVNPAGVLMR